MATIVTKLLTIVAPDLAFFGQKDAQQLAVIRRLVSDLDLPVEIVAVETVREPDGLAMSSRNAYLGEHERPVAAHLHQALLAGRAAAAAAGAVAGRMLTARGHDGAAAPPPAASRPGFAVEYVAVVDAATFREERALGPRSLLVAAARWARPASSTTSRSPPLRRASRDPSRTPARTSPRTRPQERKVTDGDRDRQRTKKGHEREGLARVVTGTIELSSRGDADVIGSPTRSPRPYARPASATAR